MIHCYQPFTLRLLAAFCMTAFLLLAGHLSAADSSSSLKSQKGIMTVTPQATDTPLVNPGKGWVAYGNASGHSKEILDYTSLGYHRYIWSKIEPKEGEYHWEIIEKDIKSWTDLGKQFAFGVVGASSHSGTFWVSPQWVFDAGAKYDTFELINPALPTAGTEGKKLVPLFADPVYMEKLKNFINAMARHFDGHPDVAFIDIRSYGNWGEGHMHPFRKHNITPEQYKEHLLIHRNAFKKTLLAMPGGNRPFVDLYPWAVDQGITIRRDGICGNSNGSETAICENRLPGIFEFYAGYPLMKELGWWDGVQDKWKRGFRPADCIETGKATWCDLSRGGKGGMQLLKDDPELVRRLTNRLGYHFVITKASWPETVSATANKPLEISVQWENRGVASLFFPVKVAFVLLDSNNNIVHQFHNTSGKPQEWKSDTSITVTDKLLCEDLPVGKYTLAVGLLRPRDGNRPVIKLGIDLPVVNGWYQLGPVNVK